MGGNSESDVHFITYNGPAQARNPSGEKPKVSWQKLASRQYHRKLRSQGLAHSAKTSAKSIDLSRQLDDEPVTVASSDVDVTDQSGQVILHACGGDLLPKYQGIHRWDPFGQSVESDVPDYVSEMLYHAISEQWKIFVPSISAEQDRIRHSVLANCMTSKATMYTIVFAGATHNAFRHVGMEASNNNQLLRISYKTQAIAELRKALNDLRGPVSEELLMCIITLAAHGSGEELSPPSVEEYEAASPLSKAQDFHYYAAMRWEEAHLEAIQKLIIARGGLLSIRTPGLLGAIVLADIFSAFRNLRPPMFSLLVPTSEIVLDWPDMSGANPVLNRLATGFDVLIEDTAHSPILAAIRNIRLVTLGYDICLREPHNTNLFTRVVGARNCLQHDLLSLSDCYDCTNIAVSTISNRDRSPFDHFSRLSDLRKNEYKILRYSVMVYVLLVLFPLPRSAGIHSKLAIRLIRAINLCTTDIYPGTHKGFLIWATMLGGAVAEGDLRLLLADKILHMLELGGHMPKSRDYDTTRIEQQIETCWQYIEEQCKSFLWYWKFDFEREVGQFWQICVLEIIGRES